MKWKSTQPARQTWTGHQCAVSVSSRGGLQGVSEHKHEKKAIKHRTQWHINVILLNMSEIQKPQVQFGRPQRHHLTTRQQDLRHKHRPDQHWNHTKWDAYKMHHCHKYTDLYATLTIFTSYTTQLERHLLNLLNMSPELVRNVDMLTLAAVHKCQVWVCCTAASVSNCVLTCQSRCY